MTFTETKLSQKKYFYLEHCNSASKKTSRVTAFPLAEGVSFYFRNRFVLFFLFAVQRRSPAKHVPEVKMAKNNKSETPKTPRLVRNNTKGAATAAAPARI